jgi:hypothetical protein
VPFEDGYGDRLDKAEMGLVHVPRVATFHGFVFCSLREDGPSLEEHLGNAAPYLEAISRIGGGIKLTAGAQKIGYDGNWKLQIENTIDPYHFSFTHKSWLDILAVRSGERGSYLKNLTTNPDWRTLDLGNGHSAQEFGDWQKAGNSNTGSGDVLPFALIVFPSLAFVGAQLRHILPRSVARTDVFLYPLMLEDESRNANTLRDHEAFYGPAGMGAADDVEVGFDRVTAGQKASATTADWNLMSRGLEREQPLEHGMVAGHVTDELPHRAYYTAWLGHVGARDGA